MPKNRDCKVGIPPGIVHDFNNLLTTIIGLTELSIEELDELPHVREDLHEVLDAAMRAKHLIRELHKAIKRAESESVANEAGATL